MNVLWFNLVAWAGLALAAVPVLYVWSRRWALWCLGQEPPPSARPRKIAILIPAHNEGTTYQRYGSIVFAQTYASSNYAVWVIADNCSDDTASLARAHMRAHGWNVVAIRERDKALMTHCARSCRKIGPRSWCWMQIRNFIRGRWNCWIGNWLMVPRWFRIRIAVQNPADSMVTRAMELS